MNEDNKQKLKKLIDSAHDNYVKYDNYQMGCKILINSYYGAFGFTQFPFYNRDIAESVTLQGKDAILYAEKNINDYFSNDWPTDQETHKKLGVKHNGNKLKDSVSVYIDTDSVVGESLIKCNIFYIKITDENNKDHYLKQTDKVKILEDGVIKVINASDIKENDNILWD